MMTVAQRLLLGSAEHNRQKQEIESVTAMLFSFADHPRNWIRRHELNGRHEDLFTSFGSFEEDGCVWEVWWKGDGAKPNCFLTRCLIRIDIPEEIFQVYPMNERWPSSDAAGRYRHYTAVSGRCVSIAKAHSGLDVFIKGMRHDFPIDSRVKDFLILADSVLK